MDKKPLPLVRLVQEAQKGSLKSPRSIVFYLLALVYILSPLDIIPDTILAWDNWMMASCCWLCSGILSASCARIAGNKPWSRPLSSENVRFCHFGLAKM